MRRTTLIILVLPLPFLLFYMSIHSFALFIPGYTPVERFFGLLLLLANIFFAVHALSYILNSYSAETSYYSTAEGYFRRYSRPGTSVFVVCYNEPPEIVESTLSAAKRSSHQIADIYLLDDSTDEEIRKDVMDLAHKYGVQYLNRVQRRGFKAGAINDALEKIDSEYLAVLDADQRPEPNFLKEAISIMESNPKLAYVQLPQEYANTEASRIALGAYAVQSVFFEYICEGKSAGNAIFSCGTNVVYRTSALRECGGFDETSVTEDLATSFSIQRNSWASRYYNHKLVKGEAPSTLEAYFSQQSRWTIGTINHLKKVVLALFTRPGELGARQWWEYIISGTWFLVGWAYVIYFISPIIFVLLGIRPLIMDLYNYLAALSPFIAFNTLLFISTVKWRGYPPKYAALNIALIMLCFPTYATSSLSALLGRKAPFKVTPKDGKKNLPWRNLWPQLLFIGLLALTSCLGLIKLMITGRPEFLLNAVLSMYFLLMLSTIFYFNRGPITRPSYYEPVFKPAKTSRTKRPVEPDLI